MEIVIPITNFNQQAMQQQTIQARRDALGVQRGKPEENPAGHPIHRRQLVVRRFNHC